MDVIRQPGLGIKLSLGIVPQFGAVLNRSADLRVAVEEIVEMLAAQGEQDGGLQVVTVAVVGMLASSDISPKKSPSARVATRAGARPCTATSTATLPRMRM